ncbi:hypothetical protein [Streptosporangium oxazolinicum]
MNPAGLIAVGAARRLPLVHLVLDDGVYDSTGGQRCAGGSVDPTEWARDCGYNDVSTVTDVEQLSRFLDEKPFSHSWPVFVRCLVTREADPPPRVTHDLADISASITAFMASAP